MTFLRAKHTVAQRAQKPPEDDARALGENTEAIRKLWCLLLFFIYCNIDSYIVALYNICLSALIHIPPTWRQLKKQKTKTTCTVQQTERC